LTPAVARKEKKNLPKKKGRRTYLFSHARRWGGEKKTLKKEKKRGNEFGCTGLSGDSGREKEKKKKSSKKGRGGDLLLNRKFTWGKKKEGRILPR